VYDWHADVEMQQPSSCTMWLCSNFSVAETARIRLCWDATGHL